MRVKDDPAVACVAEPLSGLPGDGGGGGAACAMVGVMLRKDLNPTCEFELMVSCSNDELRCTKESTIGRTNLRYDFAYFFEVRASSYPTFCKEVLNQPCSDIVTHLVELFVHLRIVFIILNQLNHKSTVSQCEKLCILQELD